MFKNYMDSMNILIVVVIVILIVIVNSYQILYQLYMLLHNYYLFQFVYSSIKAS